MHVLFFYWASIFVGIDIFGTKIINKHKDNHKEHKRLHNFIPNCFCLLLVFWMDNIGVLCFILIFWGVPCLFLRFQKLTCTHILGVYFLIYNNLITIIIIIINMYFVQQRSVCFALINCLFPHIFSWQYHVYNFQSYNKKIKK